VSISDTKLPICSSWPPLMRSGSATLSNVDRWSIRRLAEHGEPSRRRHVQQREHTQQRGLARAARSRDEHELAPLQAEIHVAQDLGSQAVAQRDTFKSEHRAWQWCNVAVCQILKIARWRIFVQ
jgi:hypothetical protein